LNKPLNKPLNSQIESRAQSSIDDTLAWLFSKGRFIVKPAEFIEALGRQLIQDGVPVWRVRFSCRTIHPLMAGWSVIWSTDMAQAEIMPARHEFRQLDSYIGSPLAKVVSTGTTYRKNLAELDETVDHRVLFELKEQGATDYLALPVTLSDRSLSTLTLVSDDNDGFTETHIHALERMALYMSPVLEVMVVRHIANAVINTYVGHRTGERVMEGQIRRGDGENISAAIWFCDLRDFTPLTETLQPQALLSLLNSYFEILSAAVVARGGEVLRFIGDAMLIVFPVTGEVSTQRACENAIEAARQGIADMQDFNNNQVDSPQLRFGIGLHIGEVIYGNVGAPDRLDFTVMGPAVNRTARLEGLTKTLGVPLLMSSTFVSSIAADTVSLGYQRMKGVAEAQEVFVLAEHQPA
jgi:adenylate cyclase